MRHSWFKYLWWSSRAIWHGLENSAENVQGNNFLFIPVSIWTNQNFGGSKWQSFPIFCESTQLLNNYIEYGISHIDSYAFVNAFCIARENLGREGENMTKKSFSYRYMLLEQARQWARRCMQSGYIQKNRQGFLPRARSYVNSLQYVFICLFFSELDTIPARESERKYHKACEKTGGMRKDVTMDCKCLS